MKISTPSVNVTVGPPCVSCFLGPLFSCETHLAPGPEGPELGSLARIPRRPRECRVPGASVSSQNPTWISRIHPGYSELRGNGENRNRKQSSSPADKKSRLVTVALVWARRLACVPSLPVTAVMEGIPIVWVPVHSLRQTPVVHTHAGELLAKQMGQGEALPYSRSPVNSYRTSSCSKCHSDTASGRNHQRYESERIKVWGKWDIYTLKLSFQELEEKMVPLWWGAWLSPPHPRAHAGPHQCGVVLTSQVSC